MAIKVQTVSDTRRLPDLKALRRLYQTDAVAAAFFDHLASRRNSSRETTVDRLLQVLSQGGSEVSRRELIALLQSLEPVGAGDFVVGRRGQPSRFRWAVGMVGLAKAARGDADAAIESIDITERASEPDDEQSTVLTLPADFIAHVYQLRPGTQVTLNLPANLTSREATRLAEFIRTLPFDEPGEPRPGAQ
jgi:hypothetical protein